MNFASDNTGPVHPRVLDALIQANDSHAAPYGADPLTEEVRTRIRALFEAPEAAVELVATGTAANSLTLATLTRPWQTIFCSEVAHIQEDECNAPEFFSGGAKLTPLPHTDGLLDPDTLARVIEGTEKRGVHGAQRGPVSITQITEKGALYSLDQIREICAIAGRHNLPVHMDGARFANAIAALDCSPADMTWKAGISALSFGGTKNGLMGVEAVVFFDPAHAWEFELRRKRGAHLFSKGRYLAAQMAAYLEDDLWLGMARGANDAARALVDGLRQIDRVRVQGAPKANIVFADWPRAAHRRLHEAGARYYLWEGKLDGPDDESLTARLVTDWSATEDSVNTFLSILSGSRQ